MLPRTIIGAASAAVLVTVGLSACAPAVLLGSASQVQQSVEEESADSVVQTDLVNAKTALIAYLTAEDADVEQADLADLASYGFSPQPGTRSVDLVPGLGANAGAFCLVATGVSGRSFVVTSNTSVEPGAECPDSY